MPIITSAKKKLRQDRKRAFVNRLVKQTVKAAVKAYKRNPTPDKLKKVYSALDTAAKKNVLHKNKANRLKSRLEKLLSKKTHPKKSSS